MECAGVRDPDNRLIAAHLEKNWEAGLHHMQACQTRLEAAHARACIGPRSRFHELGRELPFEPVNYTGVHQVTALDRCWEASIVSMPFSPTRCAQAPQSRVHPYRRLESSSSLSLNDGYRAIGARSRRSAGMICSVISTVPKSGAARITSRICFTPSSLEAASTASTRDNPRLLKLCATR